MYNIFEFTNYILPKNTLMTFSTSNLFGFSVSKPEISIEPYYMLSSVLSTVDLTVKRIERDRPLLKYILKYPLKDNIKL